MDFDEIKNTWNDSFKKREKLTSEQITSILKLKKRSNTALTRLKQSFKLELIMGAILYFIIVAGIIALIDTPESFIFIALVTLLMGTSYLLYFQTYQKIKYTVYVEITLKQSLILTVNDVERFVRFGKNNVFKMLMIPLSIIVGMTMGLYIVLDGNIFEILSSLPQRSLIKMIVLLVLFSAVLIPLSRYQFNKRFKRHIEELHKCLSEYEESETK